MALFSDDLFNIQDILDQLKFEYTPPTLFHATIDKIELMPRYKSASGVDEVAVHFDVEGIDVFIRPFLPGSKKGHGLKELYATVLGSMPSGKINLNNLAKQKCAISLEFTRDRQHARVADFFHVSALEDEDDWASSSLVLGKAAYRFSQWAAMKCA